MFGVLPRKILVELVATTLLGLVGISLLMTLVLAMVEAGRRGLDPLSVILVIPYMVPVLLPYTLPTCLLYACTVVYGGMSGSNEITALKAGGIHLGRVLWPAALLGASAAGLGGYLTDQVIPLCNRHVQRMIMADLQNAVLTYLRTENRPFVAGEYEITVRTVRGDRLIQLTSYRKDAKGNTDVVIKAEEAKLTVVPGLRVGDNPRILMVLYNVKLTRRSEDAKERAANVVQNGESTVELPMPPEMMKESDNKLECLSFAGCLERYRKSSAEAADLRAKPSPPQDPTLNDQLAKRVERRGREALGEVHVRANLSFAALPFALLGSPLAILMQRRDALQTFFMCFLPIVTMFYPSVVLSFNFFKESQNPELMRTLAGLIWIPSALMLGVAALMLRKLFRK
ncbi:MAG TPA: LptF/LptG family permease [Planctomycetia bacterium]|nr:LptF/LptG family permease [Planctomycetia bacterium]